MALWEIERCVADEWMVNDALLTRIDIVDNDLSLQVFNDVYLRITGKCGTGT